MKLSAVSMLWTLSQLAAAALPATPISQLRKQALSSTSLVKRDTSPSLLYPAHNISVPVDHFHNDSQYEPHSNANYNLRYWFDASYYEQGGPVIVLESGESPGTGRLAFLQKGILHQLIQATHGIGIVLEHRYYGQSWPTADLSTENLRFLTTDQALADTAFFAQNVVFPGLEHLNLTSHTTPWIAYGGSYAGAFVAFLRTLYPHVFWGAISSSGVTKAIYDYWAYYEPVAEYGPPDCISLTQQLTHIVDEILIGHNNTPLVTQLKTAFGMQSITYNNDFANLLASGVGNWQGRNWDPALNVPTFDEYCSKLTASTVQYPATLNLTGTVQSLISAATGYGWPGQGWYHGGPPWFAPGGRPGFAPGNRPGNRPNPQSNLTTAMLNYIGWLNATAVRPCLEDGETLDECYSTHDPTFYALDDIESGSWRSWPYQYCSQWGFLQTGSGVPRSQLPLISRTIDLNYTSIICVEAFNITTPPDTDAINKYGGFDIAYDRLAIIDGLQDPWRPATPHSPAAPPRISTTERPFILIGGQAVHHWDENGLFPNQTVPGVLPPPPVAQTQMDEVAFVKQWMVEAARSFVVKK